MALVIRLLAFTFIFLSLASNAEEVSNIESGMELQISIQASGGVLLGGVAVKPSELITALDKAQKIKGSVWYYRENPETEPPPSASQVIQMIIERKLPITMSTKPDFSNYVDENGNVHPRK
ncbi:hypothetical protein [Leucothrix arctica]|uniref:Uncharacterized protein n=1 Tax=Leucothrix arctica TaxID=1481894 RepID=A0A317CHP4_9GAMM|nr:hypothetical protein [Leucothrix arctica]PWQ98086.1 hypothetical protein DKT75_04790 [Leucothrix arctica]